MQFAKEELDSILALHLKWLKGEEGGVRADLSNKDLKGADLYGAVLSCAVLSCADLNGANLYGADLVGADLNGADLNGASLDHASLDHASLVGADLRNADLCGAKNLDKVVNGSFALAMRCPQKGAFTAYKKAGGFVIELLVPKEAKRSSATGNKCRCSKAKCVAIFNKDGTKAGIKKIESDKDNSFVYEVGKTAEAKGFDENRWNECSSGIHFFMTFEEARDYE